MQFRIVYDLYFHKFKWLFDDITEKGSMRSVRGTGVFELNFIAPKRAHHNVGAAHR